CLRPEDYKMKRSEFIKIVGVGAASAVIPIPIFGWQKYKYPRTYTIGLVSYLYEDPCSWIERGPIPREHERKIEQAAYRLLPEGFIVVKKRTAGQFDLRTNSMNVGCRLTGFQKPRWMRQSTAGKIRFAIQHTKQTKTFPLPTSKDR
ncbi:hypothetical protein LCGC14_2346780, partial [marine sediment metagenome]